MKRNSFFRKYRVEILLATLAGIAILILVGDATFSAANQTVNGFLQTTQQSLAERGSAIRARLSVLTSSDIIALGVLVFVALLIPWRIRVWILKAPRFNTRDCPKCGNKIHRARRKLLDRIVGAVLILPLRRYACTERKCGWHGLITAQSRQNRPEPFAK